MTGDQEKYTKITPENNAYKMLYAQASKLHFIILPAELFIDRLAL